MIIFGSAMQVQLLFSDTLPFFSYSVFFPVVLAASYKLSFLALKFSFALAKKN